MLLTLAVRSVISLDGFMGVITSSIFKELNTLNESSSKQLCYYFRCFTMCHFLAIFHHSSKRGFLCFRILTTDSSSVGKIGKTRKGREERENTEKNRRENFSSLVLSEF